MVQTFDLISTDRSSNGRLDARERLLDAAVSLFAERGFDGVSTRQLVGRAKVNLSAITYHFGGKEALYRAVFERIIDDMGPVRRRLIGDLHDGLNEAGGDRAKLSEVAVNFVCLFVTASTAADAPRARIQLLMREVAEPGGAFDLLMNQHVGPMHDAIGALVAAATERPEDDPRTRLLAQGVMTLCLQFALQRAIVFARMDWQEYSPERVAQVSDVVSRAVLTMLGLPMAGALANSDQ